jgi:hypothetical protein
MSVDDASLSRVHFICLFLQRDSQEFLRLLLVRMHENSAAVAELFTGKIPIIIRHLSIDPAISRVKKVGLFSDY